MSEKLRRRYFFSRGKFRIFGDPPNGTYIPARFYQIVGGKRWSFMICVHGDPTEATGREAGKAWGER